MKEFSEIFVVTFVGDVMKCWKFSTKSARYT